MSEANFKIIFRGSAVDDGEIDVRDLAPALLALGDVFQAASDVLNGDRVKTVVRVKATEQACFEVDLSIAQTAKDAIASLLTYASENKDGIAAATELAELILKAGTGFAALSGGLFALLKFLKGRKADKIEKRASEVHVHIGDNYFVTNNRTIELAENVSVREGARKFASVLNNTGIDSISIKPQGEPEEIYTKHDLPSFELPPPIEEQLVDEVRRILALGFSAESKPFESHGYKQALQLLAGNLTLSAAVADAQRNTRRYAKRQMTWFRREADVEWFGGFGEDPQVSQQTVVRLHAFFNEKPSEHF
jgi:hypothetical protein